MPLAAAGCHSALGGVPCRLASKLKTAQVSKERALQLAEAEMLAARQREQDSLVARRLEAGRVAGLAAESEREAARRADNFRAREQLEVRVGTAGDEIDPRAGSDPDIQASAHPRPHALHELRFRVDRRVISS